jgi:hypothetical protein
MPRKKAGKSDIEVKLARKHTESGAISERPRGRPSPEYVNGYLIGDEFHEGNPPKKRGRKGRGGRPKGSVNKIVRTGNGIKNAGGLNEIEKIVRREVEMRLKAAKSAALKAFDKALGV